MQSADFLLEPEPWENLMSYIDFIVLATHNPREEERLLGMLAEELAMLKPLIAEAYGTCFKIGRTACRYNF